VHELPVTRALLQTVLDAARAAEARRVVGVHVVVGTLTGIVSDSVQFYFDLLSQGTPAEGARLYFHREPAQGRCLQCGHTFDVDPPVEPRCPTCGGNQLRVSGGTNVYVRSIEVEHEGGNSG